MKKAVPGFDRYDLYRRAVQSPEVDVRFIRDTYVELTGRDPKVLREDFCGTFAISCEWAKLSKSYKSIGIDLDPEPILYGLTHNLPQLPRSMRERVTIHQANVLSPDLPTADVICAMNFSHYIFKQRNTMKAYLLNCYSALNVGGVMVMDCFGGPACQQANVEQTEHRDFTYIWEQVSFNPLTNEALFQIHFKDKGPNGRTRKHNNMFTYDWRMWSIQELRELMQETGFRKTHVYWEGTTRNGEGDGIFSRVEVGEECEAWVAYVVGEK